MGDVNRHLLPCVDAHFRVAGRAFERESEVEESNGEPLAALAYDTGRVAVESCDHLLHTGYMILWGKEPDNHTVTLVVLVGLVRVGRALQIMVRLVGTSVVDGHRARFPYFACQDIQRVQERKLELEMKQA